MAPSIIRATCLSPSYCLWCYQQASALHHLQRPWTSCDHASSFHIFSVAFHPSMSAFSPLASCPAVMYRWMASTWRSATPRHCTFIYNNNFPHRAHQPFYETIKLTYTRSSEHTITRAQATFRTVRAAVSLLLVPHHSCQIRAAFSRPVP